MFDDLSQIFAVVQQHYSGMRRFELCSGPIFLQ